MGDYVRLGLIGAGNRGQGVFGEYALQMPHRARFIAVAEPDRKKREGFADRHHIAKEKRYDSIKAFFEADLDLDGVIIATQENERLEPITLSMAHDYHILVEKPLCCNSQDLIRLFNATAEYKGILIVCHQMRLTPTYKTIKELVDSGAYGEIVCIQHSENLSYHHMAHSFVRGFFNNDRLTPMLLAKSCHDMDILTYLVGSKAQLVASFGGLKYFTKENSPSGAPPFCLDGCPDYQSCPYHVMKLYFENDTDPAYLRQIGETVDKARILELLKTGPFGRCVFQCDNNVVDNQTVQIQFANGVHVSFTMCGHNGIERRMTKISMTKGEIVYDGLDNTIRAHRFEPLRSETLALKVSGTHSGGDQAIMDNFVDAIQSGDRSILRTPIANSFEGHLLIFAAEEARRRGQVVDVREFEREIRKLVTSSVTSSEA